jgi:hypothetical protein
MMVGFGPLRVGRPPRTISVFCSPGVSGSDSNAQIRSMLFLLRFCHDIPGIHGSISILYSTLHFLNTTQQSFSK